ncbi:hypothetical protein P0082_08540 [Candidatus Haliotispira prima]|uniref:Uncharacterized protein n=1 Tax=Candidatus Haliotispira prima TaxID=3034016 RepID=A0ABY8MEV6_9SPIO|nr:hypothetical protein P0082_08540 [Candidatus Haliotispira prima]
MQITADFHRNKKGVNQQIPKIESPQVWQYYLGYFQPGARKNQQRDVPHRIDMLVLRDTEETTQGIDKRIEPEYIYKVISGESKMGQIYTTIVKKLFSTLNPNKISGIESVYNLKGRNIQDISNQWIH